MKLHFKEVRSRIRKVWPKLRHVWLRDENYWLPAVTELFYVVNITHTEITRYFDGIQDCDDFSLQLHANVNKYRYKQALERNLPDEQMLPWPFGQVLGSRFRGKKELHNANICVCEDAVRLIEPQTDEIWTADPDKDKPFMVFV